MDSSSPQEEYTTILPDLQKKALFQKSRLFLELASVGEDDDTEILLEEDDDELGAIKEFHPKPLGGATKAAGKLGMLWDDAESIVGGQLICLADSRKIHPTAQKDKPTENQEVKIAGVERPIDGELLKPYETNQKVFSFLLPLGGLSSLTRHLPLLRLPSPPPEMRELNEDIENKLVKQQLISTVDDAKYFSLVDHLDNVRFRAVKHSLTNKIDDVVPGFIKRDKSWELVYSEIKGNIVLLGGYRGLVLRDAKTHKRVWVPLTAGLKLRKVNLLLGPSDEDELKATDTVVPDGVLKNVGPVDLCKRFLKKLKANPNANVHDFGYDWRLSGDIISQQLVDFLQKLKDETGEGTIVIGHSMGGMMAHGALQLRPDLFRGLLYVGSPSECLNILGPIRYGDNVIMSDKVLTFETNFMMRSLFNFLPLLGRVFCNLNKNEYYDLDYFDPDVWVEYNLNPLVAKKRQEREQRQMQSSVLPSGTQLPSGARLPSGTQSPTSFTSRDLKSSNHFGLSSFSYALKIAKRKTLNSLLGLSSSPTSLIATLDDDSDEEEKYSFTFAESYDYLKRTLVRTRKYIDGLEFKPELEHKYPPLAVVYGNKVPLVRGLNVRSRQDIKDGNYYEFFYGHGDGVIHQKWLLPERKGFRFYDAETGEGEIVGKFALDCGHVDLMTDFKAMGEGLAAIVEAEKHWHRKLE